MRILFLFAVLLFARCASAEEEEDDDGYFTIKTAEDLEKLDGFHSGDIYDYANGDPEQDRISMRPIEIAVIIIYVLITIVGLIANLVVFFVIFAGNEMGKTVTAIYVLMLTIADTIFLFTLPVFSVQKMSNDWSFGGAACKFCQTIKFMNYYAGIFFLTAMSVDRYVAVAYSTRLTKIRTKARTYLVCAFVWGAAITMSLPILIYSDTDQGHGVTFCRIMFPGYKTLNETESFFYLLEYSGSNSNGSGWNETDNHVIEFSDYGAPEELSSGVPVENIHMCDFQTQSVHYKIWLAVDFVIAFLVPFGIIVTSYVLILTHLRVAEEKIGHTATSRAVRMRKRVTKMVAALVVCFTICWLPHHLLMLAKIKGFPSPVTPCYALEEFFIALAFSNSALNPLLYTFMGNNFQERLRKSVRNTQLAVKRRTSSRSSWGRRSTGSHSDPAYQRKSSGQIVRYKNGSIKSNGSTKDNSHNNKPKNVLRQLSLLGSKKEKSSSDINSGDGSQKAENFFAATSTMEHTMETKI